MNNLLGISGSINVGKDLVGDMLMYIGEGLTKEPSYKGFREYEVQKNHKYSTKSITTYQIKKCADKLKEVVALIIGCKRWQLEDEVFKNTELGEEWWVYIRIFDGVLLTQNEYDLSQCDPRFYDFVKLTPRLMLQLFGTQGGRKVVHPNIWVNALFSDYNLVNPFASESLDEEWTSPSNKPKWIITDVRFPENEGKAVTSRGGLLIGIKRHFSLKQPKYAHLVDPDNQYAIPPQLNEFDSKLYQSLTHESETSMGDHEWCDVIIENNGTKEELFNKVLDAVK